MRSLTLSQFKKAPLRTKSWLLVKLFGFDTRVYWHVTRDGTYAGNVGGSANSEAEARARLADAVAYNPTKYANYTVRRDLCFWMCAEYLNPAWSVVQAMRDRGFICDLRVFKKSVRCTFIGYGMRYSQAAETPEIAICGAALTALGVLKS